MRTRIGALVLVVVTGLAGCGLPPPEACDPEPVLDAQGDVHRCVAAEDCPRSSRISLCVDDTRGDVACIRCLATECVVIAPETC